MSEAAAQTTRKLGWIGTGRMGSNLATRLLEAGCDLWIYNRTRSKAEALEGLGATVVDTPAELAGREIVFVMVSGPDDLREVLAGDHGLLSDPNAVPDILVDSSTVSESASAEMRAAAAERGARLLAAPVSGNPKVVAAGLLTFVVSGPKDAFDEVEPLLGVLGRSATYVGEEERARLAKICHNLLLGIVTQGLAEILVLAEKGGISRADLMAFVNEGAMGSLFTRYKTPALVRLDFEPTFTPVLLRKDFDLGFEAADELDVPMPVTAATRAAIEELVEQGAVDQDFALLLQSQAERSGLELTPESAHVTDGLAAAAASAYNED